MTSWIVATFLFEHKFTHCVFGIRESTGMNRRAFCEYFVNKVNLCCDNISSVIYCVQQ